MTALALMIWSTRSTAGTASAQPTSTTHNVTRIALHRRRATPDAATGRISSASRHDEVSDTSARPTWTCRASNVTNTAAPMIGVTRSGLDAFHATPYSSTPRAIAVTAIAGRSLSCPIASAAMAGTSAVAPIAVPHGTPRMPARRNRAMNESRLATTHVSVANRLTGMPSMAARSDRSAVARIAVPSRVRSRKKATAAIANGATTRARRSLAPSTNVPIVTVASNGAGIRCDVGRWPHSRGISSAPTASSCVIPIVATVSTSRDACRKRRTNANSTTAPSTIAPSRPMTRPTPHGQPQNTTRPITSETGRNPRSAWAKFTIRFARYTSASPIASSAVSIPITTPRIHAPAGTWKKINWTVTSPAAGIHRAACPLVAAATTRASRSPINGRT